MSSWSPEKEAFWRNAFQEANTDGKEGLTLQELQAFLDNFGRMTQDVTEIFNKMDVNKDQVISEDELINYIKSLKM